MTKGKEGVGTAVQMASWLFGNDGWVMQLNLADQYSAMCLFRDVTDTSEPTLYYKIA